jgi:hypothetical protein
MGSSGASPRLARSAEQASERFAAHVPTSMTRKISPSAATTSSIGTTLGWLTRAEM